MIVESFEAALVGALICVVLCAWVSGDWNE